MSDAPDLVVKFSYTVARRGGHTAVEASDGVLSYLDLDRLSNQLAQRLRALGVTRDARVGISLPRGARELVCLLATAKTGAAYVPLDPTHPLDRLRDIVHDADPSVMVLHAESPLLEAVAARQVIVLEDIAQATAGYPVVAQPADYDPEQIAYILFTSGSTGRPKGVEVTRGAFANFLRSMAHTPGMSEQDRLLAITTTSFDIAGLELFLPLWVGATVVIADRETVRDSRLLRRRLEGDSISMMQATPAGWRLLLEAGWRGDGKLRMLCGGEALSPSLADRLLAAGGELWNMYGPTETTVWSTLERIEPGYDRITIGRPIDATQVYVLDDSLNHVPTGGEGEIWIGGRGLARGYRGRPDLTAERFVQNPHGPSGDRIYRTGDLGRRSPDGRLECLGRLDHQVKIRGFRVELGEIETVLRSVPGVAEALVVADARENGDPRLVAYWVGEAGRDALITAARRKLPAYMVPAAYVSLAAFPLNTNGKIDRKKLPKPGASQLEGSALRRPRTDSETRIAAVWRDVLGIADVPVDENFFTIGGTSVLAMEVVGRIERELGIEMPLQAFFEAPTVEGIVARIGKSYSRDEPIVVWLRRGATDEPPLFCLFGVHLYQDMAFAMPGERAVVGMHVPFRYVPGTDSRPTLDTVARRYVELIRRHQGHGPYHLLGLCFGGIVAYEAARILEVEGERVAVVAILDALLPNGLRVDRLERLRGYANRVRKGGPRESLRMARRFARDVLERFRVPGRLASLSRSAPQQKIDLPVEGPEVEAEVAAFAARSCDLAARLLVVRAVKQHVPRGLIVAAEQGWAGRARSVIVHDIEATHLEILREPHVRSLAEAVAAALGPRATGVPCPSMTLNSRRPAHLAIAE